MTTDPQSTVATTEDAAADQVEATLPVNRAPLTSRRPAEVTTVIGGTIVVGAALGLNLSEEALLGGLAVVTGLPSVVTWIVGVYRDAIRDLDAE